MTPGVARRAPAALILAALAVLVGATFWELLNPAVVRLPGRDSANLYAWEIYTRSVLAAGRLPHWNPYLNAGTPQLADLQTTVLYPPALLLRWLPPVLFLGWMAALHVWLAGAGTLFLGRVVGLGWPAAAAAALAVTIGGSVPAWINNGHLLLIYCAAWLPWALAFAIVSLRQERLVPHPALVVVLVLQVLAGYLQGSLYIAGAVCVYYLFSAVWPDTAGEGAHVRPLVQLLLLGVLAIGLSAFQVWPTARLVMDAGRTDGLAYEAAAEGGWTPSDLATFFFPFRGITVQPPHRELGDRVAYVGWVLACLAPFAFVGAARRRLAIAFGLMTSGAIALAFIAPLPIYRLHHAVFPGLRGPGRTLFVATLCVALLGAIGLEWIIAMARTRVSRRAAVVVALVMVAADLTVYARGAVDTVPVESFETLRRWMPEPHSGRAWSTCEHRVSARELLLNRQPSLRGAASIYLRTYADWLNVLGAADRPSDRLGNASVRRDLLASANVSDIIACDALDAPALTAVSNVDSVRVYRDDIAWPRAFWTCNAQELPREEITAQLRRGRYEAEQRLVYRPVVHVRWSEDLPDNRRRILEHQYQLRDAAHGDGTTWRYVLHDSSAGNIAALLRDPAVDDTNGIDRGAGAVVAPAFSTDRQSAGERELLIGGGACDLEGNVHLITADQPDGGVVLDVEAPSRGFVFLSEPFYVERPAFVDGVRVTARKANLAFTAVPVTAGSHHVELRYVPRSFHIGLGVSAATLVAWLGLTLRK